MIAEQINEFLLKKFGSSSFFLSPGSLENGLISYDAMREGIEDIQMLPKLALVGHTKEADLWAPLLASFYSWQKKLGWDHNRIYWTAEHLRTAFELEYPLKYLDSHTQRFQSITDWKYRIFLSTDLNLHFGIVASSESYIIETQNEIEPRENTNKHREIFFILPHEVKTEDEALKYFFPWSRSISIRVGENDQPTFLSSFVNGEKFAVTKVSNLLFQNRSRPVYARTRNIPERKLERGTFVPTGFLPQPV